MFEGKNKMFGGNGGLWKPNRSQDRIQRMFWDPNTKFEILVDTILSEFIA
jgi:hypothetical protein